MFFEGAKKRVIRNKEEVILEPTFEPAGCPGCDAPFN
ncbi:MAG: hypothetical protein JWQ40_1489 [Segetibacter sp.]|jgi:hypothetical protein|nr:hypothetical protein [Segetibacter sp.]